MSDSGRDSAPFPHDREPHKVLGVPLGATSEQIRRAYRAKAKALHPDVNTAPDAASRFAAIDRAYKELTGKHSTKTGAGATRKPSAKPAAPPSPTYR